MRHALTTAGGAALAAALAAGGARAQHCHEQAPLERRGLGLRTALGAEYATFRTGRYEGDYWGLNATLQWDHPFVRLRATMPAYAIVRNGLEGRGAGDLLLEARAPLVRAEGGELSGGPVLAATLPTGDADLDLGMGHPMLMPGLWFTWAPEGGFVSAQMSYGRALGGAGGHHHDGPRPIVNPMNESELEAAASGGYLLHELLRARAGAYGALPTGGEGAASRAAAFVGADLLAGAFDLSLEGHLPLAGDPFLAKAVVALGARF
ncbi:MAG TPA: hypothetical protein VFS00_14800 [Polyangiaceae bacterium]|nr:hypothetical protein [Polyangiaceae bacterium]